MEGTDATVVIPSFQETDLFSLTLAHLEGQSYPAARFEVIVAAYGGKDDASQEDVTGRLLRRYVSGGPIRIRYLSLGDVNLAQACNRAVSEARGDTIIFLDEELLAGPKLVEVHARLQSDHDGNAAIIGRIGMHPQIDPRTLIRWQGYEPSHPLRVNTPASFLEWRMTNLGLPRKAILEAGGFDETFPASGLEDIDLAWRLSTGGLKGYVSVDAAAFAWRCTTPDDERVRHYDEGYALYTFLQKADSEQVRERYLDGFGTLGASMSTTLAPLSARLCRYLAPNTRLHRRLRVGLARCDRFRGYRDARSGTPPRSYVSPKHYRPYNAQHANT